MTVRHSRVRLFPLLLSSMLAGAFCTQPLQADPTTAAPSGDAVQQPYYGMLNQDNVYIRSGPSDVFYATAKLNKGAKVTVVAVRDPWLKIVPPEGSYCYVARAYVEKRGDGTVGRVTKAELNVRAGSALNGLKTTVLTSLSEGDDVKILGEQEEYFKIAPPPGAYLYIMRTFVDAAPPAPGDQPIVASARTTDPIASAPIPAAIAPPTPAAAAPAPLAAVPAVPSAITPTPVTPTAVTPKTVTPAAVAAVPVAAVPVAPAAVAPAPLVAKTAVASAAVPVTPVAAAPVAPAVPVAATPTSVLPVVSMTPAPTTRPDVASSVAPSTQPAVAIAPATQPSEPTADVRFDTLESAFLEATSQPIDQQPLDRMLGEYTALSTDPALPASMQRITAMRIATIKLRSDAQKQYLDAQKLGGEARARQVALKAEQQELVQKSRDQEVAIYAVLGTLRISSLQQSGTTLYRLTDPVTGRTLVYLKSNDPKYSGLLNQFVGVKGDITEDSNLNLKVISPTSVDTIDQAKVNTTVTATVMPPSLLPKTATASIGN